MSNQKPGDFSEEYMEWANQTKLDKLTNNQTRFAEFLLDPDNRKIMTKIGKMDHVFKSVRKYLKQ